MNDIHVHVEGTVQTLAHLYNMGPAINPSLGATSQELHFLDKTSGKKVEIIYSI